MNSTVQTGSNSKISVIVSYIILFLVTSTPIIKNFIALEVFNDLLKIIFLIIFAFIEYICEEPKYWDIFLKSLIKRIIIISMFVITFIDKHIFTIDLVLKSLLVFILLVVFALTPYIYNHFFVGSKK